MSDRYDLSWSRDKLNYDPLTGNITWKFRASSRVRPGDLAGCIKSDGVNEYLYVGNNGKLYCAHRIAWYLTNGDIGDLIIDHVNGDTLDNRIENLRVVDYMENSMNRKIGSKNKTGILGVSFRRSKGTWMSSICHKKKKIHLYEGFDFFEACCRRKSAERRYGYHENHGRAS